MKTFLGCVAMVAVAALVLTSHSSARAAPAQIIFLRHAEKPLIGSELDKRGWERATALAKLFTQDPRALEHGPAAAIYAMKAEKNHGSVRAIQTMEATAQALHVKIKSKYLRDDVDDLVAAIRKNKEVDGKTVIICWEHKVIPEMLKAFGWADGPKKWDGDSYDRLWVLDFENGKPAHFRDLPQRLLAGDAKQ